MNRLSILVLALVGTSCSEINTFTTPELLLNTKSLEFNRVRIGAHDIKAVELRAGGDGTLTITSIRLAPPYDQCDRVLHELSPNEPLPSAIDSTCEFVIDERPELPLELENDNFRNVNIRYRPTMLMPPGDATLIIESNDSDEAIQEVTLRVQSATPRISARPDVVGFTGGVMGTQHVIVSNVGTGVLNVDRFELERQNDPPVDQASGEPITEFFIDADSVLPWGLGERQAVTVEVRYEPGDAGDDEAILRFFSDDPEQPTIEVRLTTSAVFGYLETEPTLEFAGDEDNIDRVLEMTNSGLGPLSVFGVTVEPDDQGYAVLGQTSFQIGGGDTNMVTVRWTFTRDGGDARAFIEHDGENAAPKDAENPGKQGSWVSLVRDAASLPPTLGIEPGIVMWGDVAGGESRDQVVTLTNVGGQTLALRRASLSTADDVAAGIAPSDPEFSVSSGEVGSVMELAPGDSHEVTVRFDRPAGDMNSHLATLVVESDAASSPDQVLFTVGAPPASEE